MSIELTGHETGNAVRPKVFIVGGRNGNVLSLAPLAWALAQWAHVCGLQYSGVLDDDTPHDSIEDAAGDFIDEIKVLQQEGPYHLVGYSCGGLIAIEMARQLRQAGLRVGLVGAIDTKLPAQRTFTRIERAVIGIVRSWHSHTFIAHLVSILKRRIGLAGSSQELVLSGETGLTPSKKRSIKIREAFERAAAAYRVPNVNGILYLSVPTGQTRIRFGIKSFVTINDDDATRWIHEYNGWRRLFDEVDLVRVAENYSSLLLEPEKIADHLLQGIENRKDPHLGAFTCPDSNSRAVRASSTAPNELRAESN